jgi:hypothetical protein
VAGESAGGAGRIESAWDSLALNSGRPARDGARIDHRRKIAWRIHALVQARCVTVKTERKLRGGD